MNEPAAQYRVTHARMLEPDDRWVHCEDDDARAGRCTVEIGGQEFAFGRSKTDPERWDPARDSLLQAIRIAFEQGRAVQRQIIRDAIGIPNGWGGPMHGRSGS